MPADIEDLNESGISASDVLDAVGCPLIVLDGEGVIVTTNRAWRSLPGQLGAIGERYLDRHRPEVDLDLVLAEGIERVLAGRSLRFEIEYGTEQPLGQRWHVLVATPVPQGAGAVVALIDVTAQHDVLDILEATAHRDALTGLPNRRAVTQRLRNAINRGRREGTGVSVVFLDLNGFKAVNDGLGHDVGDEVLAAVGRRLAGTIRSDDVLGRWGGDEFVVVVAGDEDHAVRSLAGRLHDALDEPVVIRGRPTVELGLAIGAAEVQVGDTAEDVLARADAAMFEAKRSGRKLVLATGPLDEAGG